jgi:ketosteroid isomerase-like protein
MIAGLAFLIVNAGAALGQVHGKAADAVLAADAAWEKVYAVKDLDKSTAFCDERASLLWPHMPIATGMAAVREAIAKDFSAGDLTWQANNVGVARAGDLAYVSGAYQWKLRDASGKGFVDKGKRRAEQQQEPQVARRKRDEMIGAIGFEPTTPCAQHWSHEESTL